MMYYRSWPSVCPELLSHKVDLEQLANDIRTSAIKAGFGFHRWGLVRIRRMDSEFIRANKNEDLARVHVDLISSTLRQARDVQHRESLACDMLLGEEMTAACADHRRYRNELLFLILDAFNGTSFTDFCQVHFSDVAKEFTAGMTRHQEIMLLMDSFFQYDDLVELEKAISQERPEIHQERVGLLNSLRGKPLEHQASPLQNHLDA